MANAVDVKNLVRRLYNGYKSNIPNSVIMIDFPTNNKRQPKPYATISLTTPFIEENERATRFYKEDPNDSNNRIEVRRSAPECVFSINVYSDTLDDAINSIEAIKIYFLHVGGDQLQENNIAIKTVGNPGIRTPAIVDINETRYGFDLTVQYTIESEKTVGTIGTVVSEVNGEGLTINE